jgi:hypothetical protein
MKEEEEAHERIKEAIRIREREREKERRRPARRYHRDQIDYD